MDIPGPGRLQLRLALGAVQSGCVDQVNMGALWYSCKGLTRQEGHRQGRVGAAHCVLNCRLLQTQSLW